MAIQGRWNQVKDVNFQCISEFYQGGMVAFDLAMFYPTDFCALDIAQVCELLLG